jgi:hypothetical protein
MQPPRPQRRRPAQGAPRHRRPGMREGMPRPAAKAVPTAPLAYSQCRRLSPSTGPGAARRACWRMLASASWRVGTAFQRRRARQPSCRHRPTGLAGRKEPNAPWSEKLPRQERCQLGRAGVLRPPPPLLPPPPRRAARHQRLAGAAVDGRGGALEGAADAGLVLLLLRLELLLPAGGGAGGGRGARGSCWSGARPDDRVRGRLRTHDAADEQDAQAFSSRAGRRSDAAVMLQDKTTAVCPAGRAARPGDSLGMPGPGRLPPLLFPRLLDFRNKLWR